MERIERRKSCSRCKSAFSCYTRACWCDELPRIMPLDESKGCLCPPCLGLEINLKIEQYTANT